MQRETTFVIFEHLLMNVYQNQEILKLTMETIVEYNSYFQKGKCNQVFNQYISLNNELKYAFDNFKKMCVHFLNYFLGVDIEQSIGHK